MDLPASISVEVSCLYCQRLFHGTKHFFRRMKGQFTVRSTGLSLHLRSNSCDGPCRRHYILHQISLKDFSSSLSPIHSVDPEEHNEVFFCDDDDAAEEQNELVVCNEEIATNQPLKFFDHDQSTITLADPPTSRPSSSTSYSLNHKQLDFLFCFTRCWSPIFQDLLL
jgi:hypothetical protein